MIIYYFSILGAITDKMDDDMFKKPTNLSEYLRSQIMLRGPLSVASYMRECLTNSQFGYYCTNQPFGKDNDFVTSPEISQVFGELLGVWIVHTWHQIGQEKNIQLIELGPGKGTLLSDILRVQKQLNVKFVKYIDLVEISELLRNEQANTIKELYENCQGKKRKRVGELLL